MFSTLRIIALAVGLICSAILFIVSRDWSYVYSLFGFIGSLLIFGLVCTGILISYVLPWLADRVSNSVYSSNSSTNDDPQWKAIALRNNERYEEAIAAFREIDSENPLDRFALTEIYQIQQKNLADQEAAWKILEEGASRNWATIDDKAWFYTEMTRLASEVLQQEDLEISLLEKTIQNFPETRFAANANHRLQQLRGNTNTVANMPQQAPSSRPQVPRPRSAQTPSIEE